MSEQADDAPWPVDLEGFRLWQLEGEDGPLLQELFDDLPDFSTTFGERGAADAVSTYISLPEGADYNDKLLLGLWHNGTLIGALDCIMGYPSRSEWTVGMLVVAGRHRSRGNGSAALSWLERTAAGHGADQLRFVLRSSNTSGAAFLARRGYVDSGDRRPAAASFVMIKQLQLRDA